MTLYQRFRTLPIDHAAIGMGQSDDPTRYYCTPAGAEIIGWAGVDGIHYCTIPGFGGTVFAVSPMNLGDTVHPIARNFRDLLRLILHCADMAALEQCYAWDEEQFKAFLIDFPASAQQQAVLNAIGQEFGLTPMRDPFAYVKKLQAGFDLSRIPYTEDYYDPDMNPAAPQPPSAWKVVFDDSEGSPGLEIPINKTFRWGEETWRIPAVYICDKGLVVDYCMEVAPGVLEAFIGKWDLRSIRHNSYTETQLEQIQREHPLNANFLGKVTFNGELLQNGHGTSMPWIPAACLPEAFREGSEARQFLIHYGLDETRGWSIHRWHYRWGGVIGLDMQSLSVHMERQRVDFPGQPFVTPAVGESIPLIHPLTGENCVLTVHDAEQKALSADVFWDPSMEYPTHYFAMTYTLEPDITGRGFFLRDSAEGDQPRPKQGAAGESGAAAIGIIGGADGPTAFFAGHRAPKLRVACSSLRFTPADAVQWQPVFSEKLLEDLTVQLLPQG